MIRYFLVQHLTILSKRVCSMTKTDTWWAGRNCCFLVQPQLHHVSTGGCIFLVGGEWQRNDWGFHIRVKWHKVPIAGILHYAGEILYWTHVYLKVTSRVHNRHMVLHRREGTLGFMPTYILCTQRCRNVHGVCLGAADCTVGGCRGATGCPGVAVGVSVWWMWGCK